MQQQYAGTLKFYKSSDRPYAGFGFIQRDDMTGDDFVHRSAFEEAGIKIESFKDGATRLLFDLVEYTKKKKLKAANLKLATMEW
jgi:cold shock CspA family protein